MGLEWITEKASGALQSVSNLGSSLLDSAKSLVGTETKSDKPSSSQLADSSLLAAAKEQAKAQHTVSTTLTLTDVISSAKVTVNAISTLAEQVTKVDSSTIKTGATIAGALLGGPALAPLVGTLAEGLIKVGENSWESKDQKLKVEKVSGDATAKLQDDFSLLWSEYDEHKAKYCPMKKADEAKKVESTPANKTKAEVSPEAIAWLMADKLPEQANVKENADGGKTISQVTEKGVQITKTDATGKVVTAVEKDAEKTTVRHNEETATRQDGQTVFEKPGIKVVVDQTGSRKVMMDGGRELTRNADGTATMTDKTTGQTFQISNEQMMTMLSTRQPLAFSTASADLDQLTEQVRKGLKEGQTGVVVMEGLGTRTIYHDGTLMDIRSDRTARIQTPDGEVVILDKRGRVYLNRNGVTERLSNANLPDHIQYRDGKYFIRGFEINPTTLQVTGQNASVDVANSTTSFRYGNTVSTMTTNESGDTQVKDGDRTMTTAGSNVTVTTVKPADTTNPSTPTTTNTESFTVNLTDGTLKNDLITDTRSSTVINSTKTEIRNDGTVAFDGGKGPVLNKDNSVKVDEETWVDKDMNVTSGDWHSSPKAAADAAALAEKKAATVAHDVTGVVSTVLGKTVVKWNDVQTLNTALSDITGLLGRIPPDSPAFARLKEAYGLVLQALAFATPKAHANDKQEDLQKRAA